MDQFNSSIHRKRRLPPLTAIRAFEAAARRLSFQKAAEELGVTPTAISHHVRQLEELLGLAMFERHTRRISLTDAGARLLPALTQGLDGFHEAIASLYPQNRRHAVTLTAPTLYTAYRVIPALGDFKERFPEFELRFHASDDVVDLNEGVADVAIRYGTGPFPGLISHPLHADYFGIVCSPALCIGAPEDLKTATLLHSEWRRRERVPDWREWSRRANLTTLDIEAGLRFTNDSHVVQAAIAGHGVAIASLRLLEHELTSGLLANPFGPILEGDTYHFLATAENMACPDVQAVFQWISSRNDGTRQDQ